MLKLNVATEGRESFFDSSYRGEDRGIRILLYVLLNRIDILNLLKEHLARLLFVYLEGIQPKDSCYDNKNRQTNNKTKKKTITNTAKSK